MDFHGLVKLMVMSDMQLVEQDLDKKGKQENFLREQSVDIKQLGGSGK